MVKMQVSRSEKRNDITVFSNGTKEGLFLNNTQLYQNTVRWRRWTKPNPEKKTQEYRRQHVKEKIPEAPRQTKLRILTFIKDKVIYSCLFLTEIDGRMKNYNPTPH